MIHFHPQARGIAFVALLVTCGCGGAARDSQVSAGAVLDEWHAAAASSDEARYFGLLSEDSIFLGTDAAERWDRAAFRAYAHPHFAAGRGWVFRSIRRDIIVSSDGQLAWFDEDLETEGLGPARGSGVLRRSGSTWEIVHYNLAITVPNDDFSGVRELLRERARTSGGATP